MASKNNNKVVLTAAPSAAKAVAGGAELRQTTQLWTDKYRPISVAQMCYPAAANKLLAWMESFVPYESPEAQERKRKRNEMKRVGAMSLKRGGGIGGDDENARDNDGEDEEETGSDGSGSMDEDEGRRGIGVGSGSGRCKGMAKKRTLKKRKEEEEGAASGSARKGAGGGAVKGTRKSEAQRGKKLAAAGSSGPPRAALLSGPPGVGKTTAVYMVAKELGKQVVEYNASDFRSRKSLREGVLDIVGNRVFFDAGKSKRTGTIVCTTRSEAGAGVAGTGFSYADTVLLMDEVDGCDIGGVGQIIEMIKTTAIPIVCTCNDRWHPKLRSLVNYVEDIRVIRPPCNIVANWICERVLAREGVSLSKSLLQDIIKTSGSDIRSIINNLQMWCMKSPAPSVAQSSLSTRTVAPAVPKTAQATPPLIQLNQHELSACAAQSQKNKDVGLFDAAEAFLLQGTSGGERKTIQELQAIYYNSDLVDLFVQENYLHFNPEKYDDNEAQQQQQQMRAHGGTSGKGSATTVPQRLSWMDAVAMAADSLSKADRLQRIMYMEQNWSVSTSYVLMSSILPCAVTRGKYESFLKGQQVFFDRQRPVKFPSWLGNNSSMQKNKQLLRCLTMQSSASSSLLTGAEAGEWRVLGRQMHHSGRQGRRGLSGNTHDVVADYIPLGFEHRITVPLAALGKDGIPETISFMDSYNLLRDDWDFIQDVAHFKRMTFLNVYPAAALPCSRNTPLTVEKTGAGKGSAGGGNARKFVDVDECSGGGDRAIESWGEEEGGGAEPGSACGGNSLSSTPLPWFGSTFSNSMSPPISNGAGATLAGSAIATAVKSTFTREFNKTHRLDSFIKSTISRQKGATGGDDDDNDNGSNGNEPDGGVTKKDDSGSDVDEVEKLRLQAAAEAAAAKTKAKGTKERAVAPRSGKGKKGAHMPKKTQKQQQQKRAPAAMAPKKLAGGKKSTITPATRKRPRVQINKGAEDEDEEEDVAREEGSIQSSSSSSRSSSSSGAGRSSAGCIVSDSSESSSE